MGIDLDLDRAMRIAVQEVIKFLVLAGADVESR
jgi:hypothetical protein